VQTVLVSSAAGFSAQATEHLDYAGIGASRTGSHHVRDTQPRLALERVVRASRQNPDIRSAPTLLRHIICSARTGSERRTSNARWRSAPRSRLILLDIHRQILRTNSPVVNPGRISGKAPSCGNSKLGQCFFPVWSAAIRGRFNLEDGIWCDKAKASGDGEGANPWGCWFFRCLVAGLTGCTAFRAKIRICAEAAAADQRGSPRARGRINICRPPRLEA